MVRVVEPLATQRGQIAADPGRLTQKLASIDSDPHDDYGRAAVT